MTSQLRDATITFLNTTVSLECVFAITGSAQGCRFTLTLPDGGTEIMDIDRPDSGGLAQQCATTQNRRYNFTFTHIYTHTHTLSLSLSLTERRTYHS